MDNQKIENNASAHNSSAANCYKIFKPLNGAVYKNGYNEFVLCYIGSDKWAMLHIDRHSIKGMSCPMFQHGENGQFAFTLKELEEKYNAKEWIRLDGRLRIEKIDDLSFVEYSNGKLEPIL